MRYKLLLATFVAVCIGVLGVTSAQAKWSDGLQTNKAIVVAHGETHQGSVYATGDTIEIDGTVNGDVYCAGGTINISGTINGDVMCAGQSINISGKVSHDVRLAAQNIVVSSEVKGSASLLGQNVRFEKSSSVAGDVNGAMQAMTLDGTIGKNAVFGAQSVLLNGTVAGSADISVQSFTTGPAARVDGDFHYASDSRLTIDKGVVKGQVDYNKPSSTHQSGKNTFVSGIIAITVALFVSSMVVALIAPRFLERARNITMSKKSQTALVGFAVVFATPLVVVLLMVTVVLIPFAFALLFGWLAVMALSGIIFAYLVGSTAFHSSQHVLTRMAGGSLIVVVLYLIPLLNIVVVLVGAVIGAGTIVSTLFNNYQRPTYRVAQEKAKKAKS